MVYDKIQHPEHKDFDAKDHHDASQIHLKEMHKIGGAIAEYSSRPKGSQITKSLEIKLKEHGVGMAFHAAMAKAMKKP